MIQSANSIASFRQPKPITQLLGGQSPNLPQKIGQGAVHSVADAVTNPVSYVNPMKIPGIGDGLAAAGSVIAKTPLVRLARVSPPGVGRGD